MRRVHGAGRTAWWGPIIERDPELADEVMGAIRERGALGSRDFEGAGSGVGMWNNLKPAKRMLEALWNAGELVIAGRQGFQRLYDLPERVLPADVLAAPVPDEDEVLRRLVVRAVRARGALTEAGVVEHWRLRGGTARIRPHVEAADRVGRAAAARGGATAARRCSSRADADLERGRRRPARCCSRPSTTCSGTGRSPSACSASRHLIEVYKPAPERRYGYYVLPLLGRRPHRRPGRPARPNRKAGTLRAQGVAPGGPLPQHRAARAGARAPGGTARARGRAPLDSRPWTSRPAPSTSARSPIPTPGPSTCRSTRPPRMRRRRWAEFAVRLRAHAQPHPRRAAGVPGLARGRPPRPRVRVGHGGDRRRSCSCSIPASGWCAVNDVYGGTYRLFSKVYEPKGYRFTYVTPEQCNTELAAHLGDDTALVWLETPTNPLLNVVDLRAAADAAHAAGAIVVVDNTFASPVPAAAARARRRHRRALDDEVPGRPLRRRRRVRRDERRRHRRASGLPPELARRGAGAVRRLARRCAG